MRFLLAMLVVTTMPFILLGCADSDTPTGTSEVYPDSMVVSYDGAKVMLPRLDRVFSHLASEGYEVWDFETWLSADKDNLPEKLVLLRYDIHLSDLNELEAYAAFALQQHYFGRELGTWFVMLDNPYEMDYYSNYAPYRQLYQSFIDYMLKRNEDVQPHISPCDMYIYDSHPFYENYSVDELRPVFEDNYAIDQYVDGIDFVPLGADVLNLEHMNNRLPELLEDYNSKWLSVTGSPVTGYAAHGSSCPMNAVIQGQRIMDQRCLLNAGMYMYDAYNTSILSILTYRSDVYGASWVFDPASLTPGRYQMLIHPNLWRWDYNY